MTPPICIAVPTYWTRADATSAPGDAVYDHPTPLEGESTLPSLLDSLERLDTSTFYLLVIVAVTSIEIAAGADRRVRQMLGERPTIRSLVVGTSQYEELCQHIRRRGLADPENFLALRDYPRIRNIQLVVPLALGSEAIVALDDDEIVTDVHFLEKAVEPLGTHVGGRRVDGLSGHYLQRNGSIMLEVDATKVDSTNLFDRKALIMNQGTADLEDEPGALVYTPFCFGGNMEFSRDLAAAVGFDPGITRGEDIDYLINARIEGRNFFLRKDLQILHCPPEGGSYRDVRSSKVEQDVLRFIYEKEKLRVSQSLEGLNAVYAEDLMPYPGEFLRGDLRGDAVQALEASGYRGDAEEFVQRAQDSVSSQIDNYLDFRRRWPELTDVVVRSTEIRDSLAGQVTSA